MSKNTNDKFIPISFPSGFELINNSAFALECYIYFVEIAYHGQTLQLILGVGVGDEEKKVL